MSDTSTHFRGIYVSPTATLLHERDKWQCGHRYLNGDPCCRVCDAVERINAEAEGMAPYLEPRHNFYIHAADIVMEELDK